MRVSQDFAALDTEPSDRSIWTDQLKRTQSPRSYWLILVFLFADHAWWQRGKTHSCRQSPLFEIAQLIVLVGAQGH